MASFGTLPYFLTNLMQGVNGLSALETGLGFLIPSLAIATGTQLGERLTTRIGERATLAWGFALGAVGTAAIMVVGILLAMPLRRRSPQAAATLGHADSRVARDICQAALDRPARDAAEKVTGLIPHARKAQQKTEQDSENGGAAQTMLRVTPPRKPKEPSDAQRST